MSHLNRPGHVLIVVTSLLLHAPAGVADTQAGLTEIIGRIIDDDPNTSRQAIRELATSDPEMIEQLTDMLVEPGKGNDAAVRRVLHGLAIHVSRPGAGDERRTFAEVLCTGLKPDRPAAVKRFLIHQLQIAGREESVPALAACLTDEQLAGSACQALTVNPSLSAVEALREVLPKTKGTVRLGVIQALGRPGDSESVPILITEAKSTDEAIRTAAIEALGRIGNAQAEPVIVAALEQGSPRARRLTLDAYLRLADRMLAKAQFTHVFPQGRDLKQKALKMYARALKVTAHPALRCSALRGVSKAGGPEAISLILPSIADADAVVRSTAAGCLAKMPDAQVSIAIAGALANAEAPIRARLLHVLGERKDPKATAAIEAATKDPDAEVRVTAWRLQGRLDQPSADMESTLLDAVTDGSSLVRPIALLAYLERAGARLREGDEDHALPMYGHVLKLVGSDAFRRQALADLADAGGEKSLTITEPLIHDETVRNDALRVHVGVARRVADAGNRQQAIEILQKTLAAAPARPVHIDALQQLWILGAKDDPAHDTGFVTQWWLVGPLLGNDIDQVWPPEQGTAPVKPFNVHDRQYRWTRHHTPDPQGVVNLAELLSPNENTTAYVYAEITVARARDVVLKIGSNDGMKLWLNGKVIHRFPGSRSLTVDEDTVTARLQAGSNKFLFKVTQGGGGWAACLRVTDQAGQPFTFKQKEE